MILFLILSIYQYPRILTTDLISPPSSQPVLEKGETEKNSILSVVTKLKWWFHNATDANSG